MPLGTNLQGNRSPIPLSPTVLRLFLYQENSDNPEANIESFDVIYYAALQVVIVSSANGVSIHTSSPVLNGS